MVNDIFQANSEKGRLIVLYGTNNLGKTTQARLIVENLIINLSKEGEYVKYPVYDLVPSGPLINSYLKQGNTHQFTPREFQMLHVLNRTQQESKIEKKLNNGTWIIAEDYIGTGIAWGMAAGVDKKLLYNLNSHLLKEDLGILFEGEPFVQDLDKGNLHETDLELMKKAQSAFKEISKDFGWYTVNANREKEEVNQEIMDIIKSKVSYLA